MRENLIFPASQEKFDDALSCEEQILWIHYRATSTSLGEITASV